MRGSVQEAEEPQGYPGSDAAFDIVEREEGARSATDLMCRLVATADLEHHAVHTYWRPLANGLVRNSLLEFTNLFMTLAASGITMDILAELKAVTSAFDRDGIAYALCGGLAMAVYDLPRATLDIDLLLQIDSLFSAKRAVAPLGFTLSGAPMTFHGGRIQIYRMVKIEPGSGEELVLDFLLVTSATTKAWATRREVAWEGGTLSVVSPEGLILLKSFRQSGKDLDDIEHLRSISDET